MCGGGGVKQGRFVILRFPCFAVFGGAQNTQMLGEKVQAETGGGSLTDLC